MEKAVLRVRLTPRASRSGIDGVVDGHIRARVSAPPVDGSANTALIELIADRLKIRKSAVSIRSGATSREKTIEVEGIDTDTALKRLTG